MALTSCVPTARRFAHLLVPLIAAITVSLGGGTAAAWADAPASGPGASAQPIAGDGRPGPLLGEVRRELSLARHTRYQHTTEVNEQTGTFDYDCSGFVDYALRRVDPAAYRALPVSTTRPLAQDIVNQIRGATHSAKAGPWHQVPTVRELRPGDLLSWLTPRDSDSDNTGHVMVVLATPTRSPRAGNEWLVRVADSTMSPHADDTRIGGSPTGLGTGTIGLVTDSSGRPSAYYWRGGLSTKLQRTVIALGRIG
ncbi:MAG TPA: hypothetical protein VGH89_28765 [Pseudonocardia sp.]